MPTPYELWLADKKKRDAEAARNAITGNVNFKEASTASRPQYTLPGYQGQSEMKNYDWETNILGGLKGKGIGKNNNEKFDYVTKRLGMSPGEAKDFRNFLDYQQDSQQTVKTNKDGSVAKNQNVRLGQGIRLKKDVQNDIFSNMYGRMGKDIEQKNLVPLQKVDNSDKLKNFLGWNYNQAQKNYLQAKDMGLNPDKPVTKDAWNQAQQKTLAKNSNKVSGEGDGLYSKINAGAQRIGNAFWNHAFGQEFNQSDNEWQAKLALDELKKNPNDKKAIQQLQAMNAALRPAKNKTEKALDFIGASGGELAPYTLGGAYGVADKLIGKTALSNPLAKDLARGAIAGTIAGSEKAGARHVLSGETLTPEEYAKQIGLEAGMAGGGDAALGLLGRNLNLKNHIGKLNDGLSYQHLTPEEFQKALQETFGQKGNASNLLADSPKVLPKPFDTLYPGVKSLPKNMNNFVPKEFPKVDVPPAADDWFTFVQSGQVPKARGTQQASAGRYTKEMIGKQADNILSQTDALKNAPVGGYNQRLMDVQKSMKELQNQTQATANRLANESGIQGVNYTPDVESLYQQIRQQVDPKSFDDLVKLAELEHNASNAPKDIKRMLNSDPRIAEAIKKLNALGGSPKTPIVPKSDIPSVGNTDELLNLLDPNYKAGTVTPNGMKLNIPKVEPQLSPQEKLQNFLNAIKKNDSISLDAAGTPKGKGYENISAAPNSLNIDNSGKFGTKLARADDTPTQPLPQEYDAAQHIDELINREPSQKPKLPVKEKVKNLLDNAYIKFVDDFYGGTRLDKAAGKSIEGRESATMNAHLAKGAGEKARQELESGYFDEDGNKIGKSFNEIIQSSKNPDQLERYLVARSILDYDSKGMTAIKTNGFNQREIAEKAIRDIEAQFPDIKNEAEDIYTFIKNQRNVLTEGGMLNESQVKAMDESNPNYVPMERVHEDGIESFVNANESLKKRYANVGNPVKKRTGSEREIISPLQTLVKRQYIYNNMAERNKVGEAVLDNLESLGKDNPFASIVGVEKNGSYKLVDAAGELAGKTEKEIPESINSLFQEADGKNNIVYVYKGGDKYSIQIKDKFLYDSMMSLNTKQLPGWMKIINYPTQMLRAGVTLSPDFGLRNIFRDQMTTAVTSKVGYKPFYDAVKGAAELIKYHKGNSPIVESYIRNGGSMSVLQNIDRANIVKNYHDIVGDKTTLQKLTEIAKNPLKWMEPLRRTGEFSEMATRIGHYKKALNAGMDPKEATYLARSTMDFNRAGTWGRQINQGVAFFNASIQGVDVLARAMKDRPVETLKNIGLYVALPTAALYMMNKDQDWYKEIPADARDRNWYIPVGGQVVQLPKPFEVGILFGAGLERTLDSAFNEQDSPFKDYAKQVAEAFTPDVIPTAVKPLIEVVTNHDFFTGQSIESLGDKNLNPADRHNAYNSEVAIGLAKLAEKLNPKSQISPKQIDHLIKGYTGTLGSYGTEAIDAVTGAVNPNVPDKPSRGVQTMPFLRTFFVKNLEGNNRSTNDFYDLYTKLRQLKKTDENNNAPFPYTGQKQNVERLMTAINKLQQQKKSVLNSNTVGSKDKADQIKMLNQQITDLARQWNAYNIK